MDANRQLSADTDSPGVDLLGTARCHWWLVLLMVGATSDRTKGDINLDNEAQLVTSTTVATDARDLIRATETPDELARQVRVEVPPNTTFLVSAYSSSDARTAQAGSHRSSTCSTATASAG
jgi:hypothetical protein